MPGKNYQPFLESLDELGFCNFKIFDDAEVSALLALYEKYFSQQGINGLYASHNSNPVELSITISKAIKEIVSKKMEAVFPDFNYFIGHFMVKGANTQNEFALHQDWNIVEEAKYKSYQIWAPLQLTYPANGGLFVVPGSQHFFGNYRSGSYDIPRVPYDDNVQQVVTDMVVAPGHVVCYHNSLLHGSYINQSAGDRVVVLLNIVQKGAPIHYFHKNENANCTELYDLTAETLIQNLPDLEKGRLPATLQQSGVLPLSTLNNAALTSTDILQAYRKAFGNKSPRHLKQLHITTPELEARLNETGYAVIDLLDAATIEIFKQEYERNFGNIDRSPGKFTTLQHTDAVTKKRIHEFIVENIAGPLSPLFKDYLIPVSQFYTKKAHTSGDIDIHADSTLVLNHQLEPHYGIWIPLVDVDDTNGTLTVIPYSHKISRALFTASYGGYHHDHRDWLRQFELPIKLKAGQAVIFDNNLLHNSTANQSSADRLVFTFRITHQASQYYSFLCKDANTSDAMEVSEEEHNYYMAENWDGNAGHVTGKWVGTYSNGVTHVTREELENVLNLSYS
jgi:ectoine hydroxylase-related dioxygenase (phytanoyl-CoA dioxygenase family)